MPPPMIALMSAVTLFAFSQVSYASPGSIKGADSTSSSSPDGLTSMQSYHRGGGGGGNAFSLGAQLQYSSYFGGTGIHLIGLGALGELGTDNLAYRFTFQYNFPYTQSFTSDQEATANDPANPVPFIPVTETDKYSLGIINLTLDAKKLFGDYSDGGFYLFAGVGLSLASEGVSVSYSQYDQANYIVPSTTATSQSFSQFYIRLGAGYDLKVGNGKLFGEAGIDLAANQQNGQTVDIQIPSFFHIAAGYRFSLGGR